MLKEPKMYASLTSLRFGICSVWLGVGRFNSLQISYSLLFIEALMTFFAKVCLFGDTMCSFCCFSCIT